MSIQILIGTTNGRLKKMDIFNKLKEVLIKEENIIFAYLYGSYAKNKETSDSDVDVAIYLDNEISTKKYLSIKFKLNEKIQKDIDLVILNNASTLLKFEVYQNHIVIFSRDENIESNFKAKTFFEYNDFRKYSDYSYEKIIERIRKKARYLVDIKILKKRIIQLDTSIKKIERYKDLEFEEFLKNDIVQDVIEYNLFISINMISDMAFHITVDNNMGNPETLDDSFKILWKENYLSREESKQYKKMIGMRNILAHAYLEIDKKIIYNSMKNCIDDLKRFILFVSNNFL